MNQHINFEMFNNLLDHPLVKKAYENIPASFINYWKYSSLFLGSMWTLSMFQRLSSFMWR